MRASLEDNTSTIKLLNNGRESLGKRARHFDIRLFYEKASIGNDDVRVEHYPTERMIADHSSKPLASGKFDLRRDAMMNLSGKDHS